MKRKFSYPKEFVTLPEYSAHRGQTVKVLRELRDGDEYDGPKAGLERMYKIQADDGWIGSAWESELKKSKPARKRARRRKQAQSKSSI